MLLIASALLASAAQLPPTAPPSRDAIPRDATATPASTGIIRGRVTDRDSGEPLARVIVMLVPHSPEAKSNDSIKDPVDTLYGISSTRREVQGRRLAAGEYGVLQSVRAERHTSAPGLRRE